MIAITNKDREIIRGLAKGYLEVCESERNKKAKLLWRDHNSLKQTHPPVIIDCFWTSRPMANEIDEILEPNKTESLGWVENWFKRRIWQGNVIHDDTVYDPWFPMESIRQQSKGFWGFDLKRNEDEHSKGYRTLPAISKMEDLEKLSATPHIVIDRNPPEVQLVREIIGDIMPVHVNCATVYPVWGGSDLSEALGKLVGLEEFMLMTYDEPELIHRLMAFMRDSVLNNLEKGEAAGDWTTADGCSYVINHTADLPEPKTNSYGAKLKDLWFFTHAQEFESVGSRQHEEFLLNYQMPIMKKFGLVSYGCCETLDNKIDLLRKIPNLRRICIGPRADVKKSAEQIGRDYIMSWRPNPSMVTHGYDRENCRKIVRKGLEDSRDCNIELMLKEMLTVQNDPYRLADFAEMAVEEAENIG